MRIERAMRTLVGLAAAGGLLLSAGCNGGSSSSSEVTNASDTTASDVNTPRVDWGYPLLANGGVGIGQFPAKFTFDVSAAPSCTNDFVVYNTGGTTNGTNMAGASPTTAASQMGNFSGSVNQSNGETVTIASPETNMVLTASTTINTGTDFEIGPSNTATATNLAAAIARNGAAVGVMATSSGATLTVTATNNGLEGNLITLASTLTHFSWSGGTLTGGVGAANIVAFNHLYASQGGNCQGVLANGTGPQVYWSYFTGTGTAQTSVVLSGDGTKVAFVENFSGGGATLRILKWLPNEGAGTGYPVAPDTTITSPNAWSSCPANKSCLESLALNGDVTETNSAPFYDYNTDVLYVGDNHGMLHKFTNVFGTMNPTTATAEVVNFGCPCGVNGGGWPIQVNSATLTMTGPVYDSFSGNVYIGDSSGRLSMVREVGSTVGACKVFFVNPPCLSPTNLSVGTGGSIVDAPIVDGTNGFVYAVNGTGTDGTSNDGVILQAPTTLASSVQSGSGGIGSVGGTSSSSVMWGGAFDQVFYNSAAPSVAGHMYLCGKDPANPDRPAIFQLSFSGAGVLTSVGTPRTNTVNASGEACSPVTEFFNAPATTDWIYFSIGNHANPTTPIVGTCTASIGCILSAKVGNGTLAGEKSWPPGSYSDGVAIPASNTGAASGIVVDNYSTTTQSSNIYFSLGTNSTGTGPGIPSCNTTAGVGCAIRLTQTALQ